MARLKALLVLALLASFPLLRAEEASPEAPPPGEVRVYRSLPGRDLHLYVTKPPGWAASDRRPALVFFHGGGWTHGSPAAFADQSEELTAKGLVCVAVEYRLLEKAGTQPLDPCIEDARSAMRWVRGHAAALGIDPSRIGAGGGSAGGHLAACTGMMVGFDAATDDLSISPKPQALILLNPVLDNGPGGVGYERTGERYREYSPFHNVSAEAPPTLILTGDADKIASPRMLQEFQKAMEAAHVRCDLRLYAGQGHGFYRKSEADGRYYRETLDEMERFLTSLGWLP